MGVAFSGAILVIWEKAQEKEVSFPQLPRWTRLTLSLKHPKMEADVKEPPPGQGWAWMARSHQRQEEQPGTVWSSRGCTASALKVVGPLDRVSIVNPLIPWPQSPALTGTLLDSATNWSGGIEDFIFSNLYWQGSCILIWMWPSEWNALEMHFLLLN